MFTIIIYNSPQQAHGWSRTSCACWVFFIVCVHLVHDMFTKGTHNVQELNASLQLGSCMVFCDHQSLHTVEGHRVHHVGNWPHRRHFLIEVIFGVISCGTTRMGWPHCSCPLRQVDFSGKEQRHGQL